MRWSSRLILLTGLLALGCGDTTIYAPGYSEDAFDRITTGMSTGEVERLLGAPLEIQAATPGEAWLYQESKSQANGAVIESPVGRVPQVTFDAEGHVTSVLFADGIEIGMTREAVTERLGVPGSKFVHHDTIRLYYSMPGKSGTYRARIVGADQVGRVTGVYRYTTAE